MSGSNESKSNAFSKFASKLKPKDSNSNKDTRLSMAGLLKQARSSFEKWVKTQKPKNYPMPHGIVFLTSVKGSFGWGGEVGTGIVLYRLDNNDKNNKNKDDEKEGSTNSDEKSKDNVKWSGPCAIGSGGVSFGLQIGFSKIDHIIMLPQKSHAKTFAC